ncbi:hypothetical protein TNCV_2628971 [Trichonephila clavipes]|uniref:Uncharacterized protein n=1 Tax=Trichonephila clavipes TaxID=2585209 RepID=A0A8X6SNP0_TRICX|nr:hypothetical protein TNCV_2628971 [Trichonephila clavipes]
MPEFKVVAKKRGKKRREMGKIRNGIRDGRGGGGSLVSKSVGRFRRKHGKGQIQKSLWTDPITSFPNNDNTISRRSLERAPRFSSLPDAAGAVLLMRFLPLEDLHCCVPSDEIDSDRSSSPIEYETSASLS